MSALKVVAGIVVVSTAAYQLSKYIATKQRTAQLDAISKINESVSKGESK